MKEFKWRSIDRKPKENKKLIVVYIPASRCNIYGQKFKNTNHKRKLIVWDVVFSGGSFRFCLKRDKTKKSERVEAWIYADDLLKYF